MNDLSPHVIGILLAAGAGSRFGSGVYPGGGKLLHPLNGVPIGVHSAQNLTAAGLPVTAVVRPGSDELRRVLEGVGCTVTECADAADGMGVSLAHAIAHTQDAAGWIVALADMPRIQPETIKKIADAIRAGALIAAAEYRGKRGHPVGFTARMREALLALQGDEGARALLKRHHAEIQCIAVDDPGVLFDVDRKEDVRSPL